MQNYNNPLQQFTVKIILNGGLRVYFNIFDVMLTRLYKIRSGRFLPFLFILFILWG